MEELKNKKSINNTDTNSKNIKIGPEQGKKGVIVSLLYRVGDDNGAPNNFFSQIINKIPLQAEKPEDAKEIEVPVDPNWGANLLLPKNKAFYSYGGSLPMPPCEENWYWIVFEEIGQISRVYFETLNIGFRNNIRSIQKFNFKERKITYNNNPKFDKENEIAVAKMEKTIKKYQKEIKKIKGAENDPRNNSRVGKFYNNIFTNNKNNDTCENSNNNNNNQKPILNNEKWFIKHKKIIKYSILFITFLLFVLAAVSITRLTIVSGFLPQLIISSINNIKSEASNNSNNESNTNTNTNTNNNN